VGTDDFNFDGRPDLVWQHQTTGQVGVWFMNGTSQTGWSYFDTPQVTATNWKIVATGDFNSDGRADLVYQNQITGEISMWFMKGITHVHARPNPPQLPDSNWKIVGADDFDGDGKPDLVWQNLSTGHIGVWFMDGVTQTGWSYFAPAQVVDTNWRIVPNVWNLTN
jgi:hypothetical protein